VTERQSGLRFDIYERVYLDENLVGIRELNEVELVPHMEVYTEGDTALLKGNLYLTGSYAGETGEAARTLEHLIPVEITLPLNRIQDVRQVAVEIDQFDVDLMNARSLNVTGVLTLHGIEMLSAPEEEWRNEEETVFVHENKAASGFGDVSPVHQQEVRQEERFEELEDAPVEEVQAVQEVTAEADPSEVLEAQPVFAGSLQEELSEPAQPEEQPAELQPVAAIQSVQEEKREVKVAVGSKSQPDGAYHLKSLLHSHEQRSSAAAVQEQEAPPAPRAESVEWKRLFVREDAEERFSKVRACIVQKEDTLDVIAQRYNLNPKEILLYNRISEQDLEEGKVLLIPR